MFGMGGVRKDQGHTLSYFRIVALKSHLNGVRIHPIAFSISILISFKGIAFNLAGCVRFCVACLQRMDGSCICGVSQVAG